MSELQEQVWESIRSRRLLRRGQPVLVAVSGGLDSMVLLHVLYHLAPRNGWQLTVAHLNHQLRGRSSDADERLVRQTAERLKLVAIVERAEVRQLARARGLSLEMAARKVRHDFLARTAAQLEIPSIALAHHADDQLELFFLRLLRGSGGEGLAGMKWCSPSPGDPEIELVRPLLEQPKAVLRAYAVAGRIRFREDATNALLDIQRNRVRHELLPLLRKNYQPALDRTVLRLMQIIGTEAECVTEMAKEWLRRQKWCAGFLATSPKQCKFFGSSTLFDELPVAVQRRCMQLQLVNLGVVPDFELVEKLRVKRNTPVSVSYTGTAAPPASVARRQLPRTEGATGPHYAVRDATGQVRLQAAPPEGAKTDSLEVDLAGRAGQVVFGGAKISWRIASPKSVQPPKRALGREFFDAQRVGSPIWLRHWQPGDRFQPIGMKNAVKLQDIFTNEKVPRARRHELIVAVAAGGEVFWVEGLRIGERFKLTKATIRCLQWRWQRL